MYLKNISEGITHNSLKWFWIILFLLVAFSWVPPLAWSETGSMKVKVPEALNPAFKHLMALTGPDGDQEFRPEIMDGLFNFVVAPKEESSIYYADGVFKATSAYHEITFDRDLTDILKLSYNPDLPSSLMNPSSVRLSYWSENSAETDNQLKIWKNIGAMDGPVIVKGREVVQNTPDIHTGAYYRYKLDRTLILMKHNGNNVLISLSKQNGVSDVGKKGVVLGTDTDWTYLYSEKKGLNKPGLGWVRSYMYDSYSIVVFYETQGQVKQVKCGAFKWLDAGWQKINMVKTHHIYKGLQRFGQAYKTIVENPSLPDVAGMTEYFSKIRAMEMEELQQLNRSYLKSVREKYAKDKSVSSQWVANLLKDEQVQKMDKHELRSVLMLEYLKSILGKSYHSDLAMR
jgi:hypothetical protein